MYIISSYNGCTIKRFYQYGILIQYTLNGLLHNPEGPASIKYRPNKIILYEEYFINGLLHNDNSPANIQYWDNGEKMIEHYYINGEKHRLDGPALIRYCKNGQIEIEQYWINGVFQKEVEYTVEYNSCQV